MRVEKLQRPRKEAAGSRHEPGVVRQTAPAEGESIVPQTESLMEEVLRRENLIAEWGLRNLVDQPRAMQRST